MYALNAGSFNYSLRDPNTRLIKISLISLVLFNIFVTIFWHKNSSANIDPTQFSLNGAGDEMVQLSFTCSKSITKTLEKVVKFVQNYKWWYQNDVIDLVLVSLLLTLSIPFSSVSINCYYTVELNKPRTKFWLTFVARRCRSSRQAKQNNFSSTNLARTNRAHSLVVSSLRSVTKGSRFEFGCYLCAEVSSLQ